jgi:3-methyl-2-oxobutanoate hydroxymethyltransferase
MKQRLERKTKLASILIIPSKTIKMSQLRRNNIQDIKSHKGKEPITCVAAYTYPVANLIDEFCDVILVGDSLGMTIYGMSNTLGVSVEMMINHGKAVVKATKKSLIVVDLPYGSYEQSTKQAYESASRVINETGCDAVKLEITPDLIETIQFLTHNNIPVISHIGLIPQHVEKLGGFKIQGRDEAKARELVDVAIRSQEAGAFCVVIEGVIEKVSCEITNALKIPTIGIGASPHCDGQVLVIDDILGIKKEYSPKFVKAYADVSGDIRNCVKQFSQDVKSGKFPTKDHCFY